MLRPDTEAELAGMIRAARGPLAVRGGGTRSAPPPPGAAVLSLGGLSGITLYEPEALTLVVRAGTALDDILATLAAEGQMLAFEPDRRPGSTIGGVVATNASGPRRVQAGACRDALLGVRLVDGEGRVIRNGGRVMKNVTGYDLVKLVAGARGRLGVLTELALRTQPVPPASATLAVPGLDAAGAVAALTAALAGPQDVSGAAWLPGQGALIRLEGLEGSVAIRARALRDRLAPFGELAEAPADIWSRLPPRAPAGEDLWRIVCRPSEAGALLAALPRPLGLDWGGALIWVALPAGALPVLPRWSGHARRIGGGPPAVLPAPDPLVASLETRLCAAFDPRAILGGDA